MKNQRICPKCGGSDIRVVDGYIGAYGSGNNIMLGATMLSAVGVDRYICCSCGYTEEWIDTGDLAAVKKSKKAHI